MRSRVSGSVSLPVFEQIMKYHRERVKTLGKKSPYDWTTAKNECEAEKLKRQNALRVDPASFSMSLEILLRGGLLEARSSKRTV